MEGSPFHQLRAWHSAMQLCEAVYRSTQAFPRNEEYGLKSQLRRAAVSVAANIAEGQGRTGRRAFAAFLDIALGSLREVETLLDLASRLGCAPVAELAACQSMAGRTASELIRLQAALRGGAKARGTARFA